MNKHILRPQFIDLNYSPAGNFVKSENDTSPESFKIFLISTMYLSISSLFGSESKRAITLSPAFTKRDIFCNNDRLSN
jgi:hypothetical protein